MTRSDRTWWRVLVARGRALVRPQHVHDEIDEELRFHLEMRVQEHVRDGMSESEARRAAARAFGSMPVIKELSYDIRGGGWVEAVWRDVMYATRALVNQRALSIVVIGIVAIGIGANAAILGVADRVLWRELPVHAPGELEQLAPGGDLDGISYPLYQELRRDADAFSGVFARWQQTSTFGVGAETERAVVELVSGNYFSVLGVRPEAGRLLSDDDDRTIMGHPVAVVSHRFWHARLGGEASAIGRTIRIDDYLFTIVGVAPPKFFGVEVGVEPDAWVPLAMHPVVFDAHRSLVNDSWMWLDVLGRRAPGWSTAAAEARASVVAQRFRQSTGERSTSLSPGTIKLRAANRGLSRLRGSMTVPLAVLIGIVAFVLVIACANVATLVLVRSMARSREMGVRLALGASRARVIRQLLLENLLLASVGGIIGTVLAAGASRALVRFLLPAVAFSQIDVTPDARLLVITLALTTITGVLFGIAPAARAARLDVASIIKGTDRPRRSGRWRFGIRPALVAGQVAVSLVLVIAAGLFAKSLDRLASVPPGFDADHVLVATISPTLNRYTPETALELYRSLETRLSAVAGVRAVGTSAIPLLGGHADIITLWVPGRAKRSNPLSLLTHSVSGDFFGATGVGILRGRALSAHEATTGPIPLVLNETAAREYFGDQDPVGRSARIMGQPAIIVGLAHDSKYRTMREAMPQIVYATFDRSFDVGLERTIYVRTTGDPAAFASTLQSAVHNLDPTLPVYDVRTLAEQRSRSMASERVVAWLSGLAAGIALLLAAIGLYGLVSFDAQLRTREIGVRISLGATRSRIMALVLRGALALLVAGTLGGLALSLALSKLVASQLYGVSPRDVTVAVAACLILSATAFVAASLPAWRAAGITPLEALRCE